MRRSVLFRIFGVAAMLTLFFALSMDAFAQGRGRGNSGGGGGSSQGRGNSGGMGGGSNRDDGWGGGNSRRPDSTEGGKRNKPSDRDADSRGNSNSDRRYTGLSKQTGIPADQLKAQYDAARAANPDLKYGQFVAANMIARKHDGISSTDILSGLRNGRSIGQTLQDKGWSDTQIKKERKRIKDANKKNDDYDDDDWEN